MTVDIKKALQEIGTRYSEKDISLGEAHYKGDGRKHGNIFEMYQQTHSDVKMLLGISKHLKTKLDIAVAGIKDTTRGCYECDAGMHADELLRRLKDVV